MNDLPSPSFPANLLLHILNCDYAAMHPSTRGGECEGRGDEIMMVVYDYGVVEEWECARRANVKRHVA